MSRMKELASAQAGEAGPAVAWPGEGAMRGKSRPASCLRRN